MSNELVKIYDLKEDQKYIQRVQEAILESRDARDKLVNKLSIDKYGLVGSVEWWNNIENGTIPVYFIEGLITRVYMSGHNDFPEIEVDDGHEKTTWMRQGKDEMYKVGKKIKIKYSQKNKPKNLVFNSPNPHSKQVLEIWVGSDI